MFFPIRLIRLAEVDSTNDYFNRNTSLLKDWTIVWAEHQTHGRGIRGNVWQTERAKNLTFGIALNPKIKIQEGFLLNMLVCNAIHKVLRSQHNEVWIKWPNDIILMHKKICGVLIENHIHQQEIVTSIIGIGLNVHQVRFDKLLKASSLKELLGKSFDLYDLLMKIIKNIQNEYIIFNNYGKNIIQNYYLTHLYRKDYFSSFQIEGSTCSGVIRGLTEDGRLIVTLENQSSRAFSHKEIDLHY